MESPRRNKPTRVEIPQRRSSLVVSHASAVAKTAGVNQEVLERSKSVLQSIGNNEPFTLDDNQKDINDVLSN